MYGKAAGFYPDNKENSVNKIFIVTPFCVKEHCEKETQKPHRSFLPYCIEIYNLK